MLKSSFKASVILVSLVSFASFASAEKIPKQSRDFKGNYTIALTDSKAKPETALCSATAHDLTKNKKYKYDRFGFTQADYDAVTLNSATGNGTTTVKLNGEARLRTGATTWDTIAVECVVSKNKVRSISVAVKK